MYVEYQNGQTDERECQQAPQSFATSAIDDLQFNVHSCCLLATQPHRMHIDGIQDWLDKLPKACHSIDHELFSTEFDPERSVFCYMILSCMTDSGFNRTQNTYLHLFSDINHGKENREVVNAQYNTLPKHQQPSPLEEEQEHSLSNAMQSKEASPGKGNIKEHDQAYPTDEGSEKQKSVAGCTRSQTRVHQGQERAETSTLAPQVLAHRGRQTIARNRGPMENADPTKSITTHSLPSVPESLPNSSAASFPTSSSKTKAIRERSTSPVKKPFDLLKLKKQVSWNRMTGNTLSNAIKGKKNPDAIKLLKSLDFKAVYPSQLKDVFIERGWADVHVDGQFIPPQPQESQVKRDNANPYFHWLEPYLGSPDSLSYVHIKNKLMHELETIEKIADISEEFRSPPHAAEPEWNEDVHKPILNLALEGFSDIKAFNVTRTTIDKEFIPPRANSKDRPLSSRMIDYVIAITGQEKAVANFCLNKMGTDCFNNTQRGRVQYAPMGILVETKVGAQLEDDAMAQLGLWAASLIGAHDRFGKNRGFLPLVVVLGAEWFLWFAIWKQNDEPIEVYGHKKLGDTSSVPGIYRLIAALRVLFDHWMRAGFGTWVTELCT